MNNYNKIVILFLILFLCASLSAQNSLNNALFYIENNSVNNLDELDYKPKNKFEQDFLAAVIDYKKSEFDNVYNLLKQYLVEASQSNKYYEYLAKSAHILNKESELKEIADDNVEYNYLLGIVDYLNTDYTSAVDRFDTALQSEGDSVDVLIYLSNNYRKLGDYEKANQTLETAQAIAEKNDPKYSEILVAKGSLFFLSGQYEKAQEIYKAGLKLADETGNNLEVIKATLNLGMISDLYGDSQSAQDYFAKAYNLSNSIDLRELEAIVLSEWGVSFTFLSMPIEARNKYEESYKIFKEFNNNERMALTAINIASQFLNINNYQSALKKYNLALDLAGENLRTKMLAYRGLGDVYTNLSNYSTSLEFYNKAKEISKQLKDISAETEINLGIGTLYYNLRDYDDALNTIMDTYENISESVNPYLKAELNQKAGIINLALSNHNQAEEYLLNAIKLSDEYGDVYSSILSNTYLAYSYIKNNNVNEGKKILSHQIQLCEEYSLNQLLGMQYLILSEVSRGTAKQNYLNKAKENSILANDESNLINIYEALGQYYAEKEEVDKAEEQFINAIVLIENTHKTLGGNQQIQIDYFSDKANAYNLLANLYLSKGENEKAFAVIDKSRSRNTMYNLSAIRIASVNNEALARRYYDMQWKVNHNLLGESVVDSVQKELQQLAPELGVENESINSSATIKSDIENYLEDIKFAEYEVFIKYFINSGTVYIFILDKDGFSIIQLPSTLIEIKENISRVSPYYSKQFNNNEISFNKDLFAFKSGESHKLYKKLFEPIANEIPKNSKLIFSLPNELLNIPFEFLSTSTEKSSPHFMVEDYSISYIPSLAILQELKTKPIIDNSFALIAGEPDLGRDNGISETRGVTKLDLYARNINLHPLKYSLDEVETIEGYFANDILLTKNKATETNFISNAQKASVIHLSTHSFLFDNNPVVLLSEDDKNDGILETGEIAKLRLKSDLVVLSSCKSGLGKIEDNEGIVGMQKAFFDVGASSIILSLWDVSDEHTAELMKYFYGYLSEGYNNSDALQKAKIKFIKEVDPNPYYWAAFVLAGKTNNVKIEKEKSFGYLVYVVVFILLILVYYLIKNRKFYNLRTG